MSRRIEKIIIITVLLLSLWGIVAIMSSGLHYPGHENLYIKQGVAALAGLIALLFLKNFSYKFIQELSPLFYLISIILLVAVLFVGTRVHGSQRWFNLGVVYFQPSELAKLAFILFAAYILEKKNSLLIPFLALGAVSALVAIQPDAGTAILFFPVILGMLSVSRLNVKWLGGVIIIGCISLTSLMAQSYLYFRGSTLLQLRYILIPVLISAAIIMFFIEIKRINRRLSYGVLAGVLVLLWVASAGGYIAANSLREYQRRRIVSYMIPELDPSGAGYSTRQSLLAVGSGRMTGKGLFSGTQTQLGFLPARHNDFIFSVIAEETGFAGSVLLLFLLFLLGLQMAKIINRSEDYGGRLIAAGIFCLFLAQGTINIFVALGLIPVMGTQLPFVSYGGSGLLLFFSLIGILLNINRRTEIIAR